MALRKYWTFDQVKDKILLDCDLLGQNFITTDEMAGYINQAIDQAEREVHTLYKDYFLKSEALNMERGQERFDLPKDCLLYTSPSPRDRQKSRMPSSA